VKRNSLIEHKEVVVVCEESGPINLSYNVLLTTPEVNTIIKPIILVVTTKSTLTYTNCDKTGHLVETCHNKKKEVPSVPTVTFKSTKLITKIKTQLVKLGRIPICYPYIICFTKKHKYGECSRKIEVQNMFKTKLVSFNAMTSLKPPKINNVAVNVVTTITSHNQ